jgi:Pyruvate/2-oxoacid:ferredoxin oxidoreductase gamma subunit
MVMVGAASHLLPVEPGDLEQFISETFRRKGERVVDTNLRAFHAGMEAAGKGK